MTSGGTESLIMSVKTYRDYAKATRGVTKPNMVMSVSAFNDKQLLDIN